MNAWNLRLVRSRAELLLGAATVGAATTFVSVRLPGEGKLPWLVDLASHWQWAYLVIGLASALWLVARRRRAALLPLAVIVTAWFHQAPSVTLPGRDTAGLDALTVVSANMHLDNPDPGRLLSWADSMAADIVVVQEFTHAHAEWFSRVTDYPHRVLHPEAGPFGLAILSRLPLHDANMVEGVHETPVLRAEVVWNGHRLRLSAVHPMPPLSPLYHGARQRLLSRELEWGREQDMPHILAGDLNATPWSSSMHRLFGAERVHGFASGPTWPARFPVLPIDHVIGSRHWQHVDRSVGPYIGSDHRPVVARLQLAMPGDLPR